jgi:tellurite resistance protein TerC
MQGIELFPFSMYWSFYAVFFGFVLIVILLDLGVFHRKAHALSFKEASVWCCVWISLGWIFSLAIYYFALWKLPQDPRLMAIAGFDVAATAKRCTLEYITGLIIEQSLSVDNLFVFVVLFDFFAIPQKYQHRVLFFGILGALVFRTIFIALGTLLMAYTAVVIGFGVLLMFTGIKLLLSKDEKMEPEKNPVLRFLRRVLPVTPEMHGQKMFLRRDGKLFATPLFVALAFIEISDVIFALDSVPAIFAISREPLVILTSNIFAIMGLRAMYFVLARIVGKFRFLKYGLGIVLFFVGIKMAWLNELFDGHFPISWSLGFIALAIGLSIAVSLLVPEKKKSRIC